MSPLFLFVRRIVSPAAFKQRILKPTAITLCEHTVQNVEHCSRYRLKLRCEAASTLLINAEGTEKTGGILRQMQKYVVALLSKIISNAGASIVGIFCILHLRLKIMRKRKTETIVCEKALHTRFPKFFRLIFFKHIDKIECEPFTIDHSIEDFVPQIGGKFGKEPRFFDRSPCDHNARSVGGGAQGIAHRRHIAYAAV